MAKQGVQATTASIARWILLSLPGDQVKAASHSSIQLNEIMKNSHSLAYCEGRRETLSGEILVFIKVPKECQEKSIFLWETGLDKLM